MKQLMRFPQTQNKFNHNQPFRLITHILLILFLTPMSLNGAVESVLAERSWGTQRSPNQAVPQDDSTGPTLVIQAGDYQPGKTVGLHWEILGRDTEKQAANWSIRWILPSEWQPAEEGIGTFDPQTSTLMMQEVDHKGKLSLQTQYDAGDVEVQAELLDDDTVVSTSQVSLRPKYTGLVDRGGGEVTGRIGKRNLKIKVPANTLSDEAEIVIQSPQTPPASLPPSGKDPFELFATRNTDGKAVHQFAGRLEIEIDYEPEGDGSDSPNLSIYYFDEELQAWIPEPTVFDRAARVLRAQIDHFSLFAIGMDTSRGHSCAVTDAGGVKCWGDNYFGQLGDDTTVRRSEPVDVVGLSSGVSQVMVGGYHTCALTIEGAVKCWGENGSGQLGDGTTTQRLTPVNVNNLTSGIVALAAGTKHTCALTSSGGVQCWGMNSDGQLGDATTTQRLSPVNVSGLSSGIAKIAGGERHTCALSSAGGLACWGWNGEGQLGDGTTTQRLSPVAVNGLSSGVIALAAGYGFTCALTNTGGMKCWGDNYYGQLGDGTYTQRLTPNDVSGLNSGVTALATGFYHTCAVITGGAAKCWGWNGYGQLGDGTTTQRWTPVDVSGLTSGVTEIAAGSIHSCALTSSGMMCWGGNYYGQLGDGTPTFRTTPVDVSGLSSGVTAITSGYEHNCAVNDIGGVNCWGWNVEGQLGNGNMAQSIVPVAVTGLSGSITMLSAGYQHSCALTDNGGVKCWGDNYYAQLGDGTQIRRLTPVDVSGLSSGVTHLTAGSAHTCVVTNAGAVKCWGDNSAGQLGDGTVSRRLTPVYVSGLSSGVSKVAAGYGHTCAITSSGGVKCWGWNGYGQLGDGTTTTRITPVDVSGLSSGVVAIALGYKHTCALLDSGGVKCWGWNAYGQLGDGTTDTRLTPVDVGSLSGINWLAVGYEHSCAVTSSGGATCWGQNSYGQLGDGTLTPSFSPVSVSGLSSGVAALSGGYNHTCALLTAGGVQCWGDNIDNQLGDGTPIQRLTPVEVVGNNDITLTISTTSPYIGPDDTVTMDWQVGGFDPATRTTDLVFSVPSGFTPVSSGGTFDPVTHILSLPVTGLSGQVSWAVDRAAEDPFTITARLFEQANELKSAELVLNWPLITTWESDLAHAYFGHSLGQANMNGDTYLDLVVGAPGYGGTGAAFIYYGSGHGFTATADLVITGQSVGDKFGWSVASAGDVNNDGYEDVIIGAIGCSQPETHEGCVYVYFGSALGLNSTPNWSAEGNQGYSAFGYVVGTAGDVNGDGISDFFIGAPNYSNGDTNEGKLDVYYGSASGLPATPDWSAEGGQAYAYFGLSAAAAGDATGDAIDDLIVGAPNASGDLEHEGKVYLYAGAVGDLNTNATWTAEGNQAEAHFGEALSAGDLTGDGIQDIIVGAPDYDDGETDEGAVFVYFNSASGLGLQPGWSATSNQAYASFGIAVTFISNVEENNVHGLAIGANRFDDGEEDEGRVFLFYTGSGGIDPNRLWTVDGDQAFANLGYSVVSCADVNGDGLNDFFIGMPQSNDLEPDEGQVLLFVEPQ